MVVFSLIILFYFHLKHTIISNKDYKDLAS